MSFGKSGINYRIEFARGGFARLDARQPTFEIVPAVFVVGFGKNIGLIGKIDDRHHFTGRVARISGCGMERPAGMESRVARPHRLIGDGESALFNNIIQSAVAVVRDSKIP